MICWSRGERVGEQGREEAPLESLIDEEAEADTKGRPCSLVFGRPTAAYVFQCFHETKGTRGCNARVCAHIPDEQQ